MITSKLKICSGCGQSKVMWKSQGKEKFCKECWYQQSPPKALAKPTSRPNPISQKMKQTMSIYDKKRTAFMSIHPYCQASLPGCGKTATDVHHMAGRGESHNDINTWLAVCRPCHTWIENNPGKAKALGLSINRLNTEENE